MNADWHRWKKNEAVFLCAWGLMCLLVASLLSLQAADLSNASKPDKELNIKGTRLPLIQLPLGDHVVTIVEWYSLVDHRLHAPKERRKLVELKLEKPVWLGQFEVTQDLYEAVMGNVPSHLPGDPTGGKGEKSEFPVHFVSASDAIVFCERLTDYCHEKHLIDKDQEFRLPWREEWQLAAQEGRSSSHSNTKIHSYERAIPRDTIDQIPILNRMAYSLNDVRHEAGYAFNRPWKIGLKEFNQLGFADLFGNVEEWTSDCLTDRFFRTGGSWMQHVREYNWFASFRPANQRYRTQTLGFRVALASRQNRIQIKERFSYAHLFDYRVQDLVAQNQIGANGIHDALIHPDGSLWVSSDYSLIHITGTKRAEYDGPSTHGKPILTVTHMVADSEQRLWLFCEKNQLVMCYHDNAFHTVPPDQLHGDPMYLISGVNGRVWGRTTHGGVFRLEGCPCPSCQLKVHNYGPEDIGFLVKSFWEIDENVLIASGSAHSFFRVDLSQSKTELVWGNPSETVRYVRSGGERTFWMFNSNEIRQANRSNFEIMRSIPAPGMFGIGNPWKPASGADDGFWLNLPELVQFTSREGWFYYPKPYFQIPSLPVLVDKQDGIWIKSRSENAGLWRVSRGKIESITYQTGITTGNGRSSCIDGQGGVWLSTDDGGIVHWTADGEMLPYYNGRHYVQGRGFGSVYADTQGRVWLGLYDRSYRPPALDGYTKVTAPMTAVVRLEKQAFRYLPLPFDLKDTDRVRSMTEDHDGFMWFGSEHGLIRYKDDAIPVMYTSKEGLPEQGIRLLHEDRNNRLWIGSHGGGLAMLNQERNKISSFTRDQGLASDFLWSVLEDKEGVLWFGGDNGLTRYKDGEFSIIPPEAGMPDKSVNSLFEDNYGNFWVGCNRGIYRVASKQLHSYCDGEREEIDCYTYGEMDGMEVAETNGESWPCGSQLPDGGMIFPTPKGFELLRPETLLNESNELKVHIHSVISHQTSGEDIKHEIDFTGGKAKIQPDESGTLEITFAAMDYVAPELVRYRYRLKGVFHEWREIGNKNSVLIGDLEPGTYRIEVTAKHYRNVWTKAPVGIDLIVLPHWYETTIFRMVALSALLGIVWTAQHLLMRRKRQAQQQRVLQQFNEQRDWITKDIHDEIGTDFAKIASLSRELTADRESRFSERAKSIAQSLQDSAMEGVDNIRRILWSSNPKNDSLDQLIGYMVNIVDRTFRDTPVKCRIDAPVHVPTHPISPFIRHQLVMIIKEAMNNIIRHAEASHVEFKITSMDNELTVSIRDDGRGFNIRDYNGDSSGLSYMRTRSEKLEARFKIKSEPGKGCHLYLSIQSITELHQHGF